MKKQTKKALEDIAEMWYKRAQKLANVVKNPHCDFEKKQKANRLMKEMSLRLTKIAIVLTNPNVKAKKDGGIMRVVKP